MFPYMPSQALPPQKMSSRGDTRTTGPSSGARQQGGRFARGSEHVQHRGCIRTIFLMQASVIGMLSSLDDGDDLWYGRDGIQPWPREPSKGMKENTPYDEG